MLMLKLRCGKFMLASLVGEMLLDSSLQFVFYYCFQKNVYILHLTNISNSSFTNNNMLSRYFKVYYACKWCKNERIVVG